MDADGMHFEEGRGDGSGGVFDRKEGAVQMMQPDRPKWNA